MSCVLRFVLQIIPAALLLLPLEYPPLRGYDVVLSQRMYPSSMPLLGRHCIPKGASLIAL